MAKTIKAWFIKTQIKEFETGLGGGNLQGSLSQRTLGYRSKRSEQNLVATTIKFWFMEACPILVTDPAMEADFDSREKIRERETRN